MLRFPETWSVYLEMAGANAALEELTQTAEERK